MLGNIAPFCQFSLLLLLDDCISGTIEYGFLSERYVLWRHFLVVVTHCVINNFIWHFSSLAVIIIIFSESNFSVSSVQCRIRLSAQIDQNIYFLDVQCPYSIHYGFYFAIVGISASEPGEIYWKGKTRIFFFCVYLFITFCDDCECLS